MTKSHPLQLLVVTLCMLLAALIAFWFALTPQRMLGQLKERMLREQELTLEAKNPRLRFDGNLILLLDSVTLTEGNDNAAALTARDMTLDVGVLSLFGGTVAAQTVTLNAPIMSIDIAANAKKLPLPARVIVIREGVVKLRDVPHRAVVALSDVNGRIAIDNSIKLDMSFMQNGSITTLVAEAESGGRLLAEGSPVDISLSAKDQIMSFSGRARYSSGLDLDGQVMLDGGDAAKVFTWIGMPLRMFESTGPVAMTAGVSTDGLSARLNALDAKIGAQNLKGQANIQAGPDRIKLSADLAMAGLNLLPRSSLLAYPWSEKPFDIADLSAVDADVKLKAEHLSLRGLDQGPADVVLASKDGKTNLDVTLATAKLHAAVVPQNNRIQLDATVDAKSTDAKTFVGGLLGFDRMAGRVDLSVNVSAEGASPAAVVSTLKGSINFVAKKLTLNSVDLTSLIATPHEGWQSGDTVRTENFDMAFEAQIDDGIAVLKKADFTIPGITLKAKGEIDLLRQAFGLSFAPKGKVQSLKGTWVLPLFAADAGTAPALRPVATPAN
jgi:AsmA protein